MRRLCLAFAALAASGGAIAQSPPAYYALGTPAAAGEFAVTVTDVQDARQGDRLVSVSYRVQNIAPMAVPSRIIPPLFLLDPSQRTFPSQSCTGQAAATLLPRDTVHFTCIFRVPAADDKSGDWLLRIGGPQGARIPLK